MEKNFDLELMSLMEEKKISYEQAYERLNRKHRLLQLAKERQLAKQAKEAKKTKKTKRTKRTKKTKKQISVIGEEINHHETLNNNLL